MKWADKRLVPLLLVLLSSSTALLLCEAVLRLFNPQPLYSFEKDLFSPSKDYGYFLTPNVEKKHSQPEYSYSIKSNSYGFRGREPNFDADFRVLVLGDSYGMGQGVTEGKNICDLSQSYFNQRGMAVDVFNTSISGYSGFNQTRVLSKFIKTYKPHLVLLLFFRNDIGVDKSLEVQNGYLVIRRSNDLVAHLREWLNNHSHFYCLIKRFYYNVKGEEMAASAIRGLPNQEAFAQTAGLLKRMESIVTSHNSEFIVILLPIEMSRDLHPQFELAINRFCEILDSTRIRYENWQDFLPHNGLKSLFYPIDRHWTEKGHAYFSPFLIRKIEEKTSKND